MNLNIEGEISLIPNNKIIVSESETSKIFTLINLLEDHDDVQKVHSNIDLVNIDIDNIL